MNDTTQIFDTIQFFARTTNNVWDEISGLLHEKFYATGAVAIDREDKAKFLAAIDAKLVNIQDASDMRVLKEVRTLIEDTAVRPVSLLH